VPNQFVSIQGFMAPTGTQPRLKEPISDHRKVEILCIYHRADPSAVASSSRARFTKLLAWDLRGSAAVQNAGRRHTHEERPCRVPEELLFLARYWK